MRAARGQPGTKAQVRAMQQRQQCHKAVKRESVLSKNPQSGKQAKGATMPQSPSLCSKGSSHHGAMVRRNDLKESRFSCDPITANALFEFTQLSSAKQPVRVRCEQLHDLACSNWANRVLEG